MTTNNNNEIGIVDTQPQKIWSVSTQFIEDKDKVTYYNGKGMYCEVIPKSLIEQLQSEAIKEYMQSYMKRNINFSNQLEEARTDERKKIVNILCDLRDKRPQNKYVWTLVADLIKLLEQPAIGKERIVEDDRNEYLANRYPFLKQKKEKKA